MDRAGRQHKGETSRSSSYQVMAAKSLGDNGPEAVDRSTQRQPFDRCRWSLESHRFGVISTVYVEFLNAVRVGRSTSASTPFS